MHRLSNARTFQHHTTSLPWTASDCLMPPDSSSEQRCIQSTLSSETIGFKSQKNLTVVINKFRDHLETEQTFWWRVECVPEVQSAGISRCQVIKFSSQQDVILRLYTATTTTTFKHYFVSDYCVKLIKSSGEIKSLRAQSILSATSTLCD